MLTFVIPVKSKSVSSDWTNFSQLFEKTLKSICNQKDSNFKVVVVCHETPEINFSHENLHFIHPDFEPPSKENISPKTYLTNQRIDKGNKIKLGVAYASKELNADYVMLVDSDDLVSNNVATFVNNNGNDLPGWYVGKGYLNFKWKNIIVATKKFNYLCGSCIIIKPNLIEHFFDKGKIDLYFDHRLTSLNSNIELKRVPFCAAIYNIGNGENIYMSFQKVKKFNNHWKGIYMQGLKRLYGKFRNYHFRFITPKFRAEFKFYPNNNQ